MALIDRFPTTGWKNNELKEVVRSLVELEEEFTKRKAPATLGSILLTLATVFKDDAGQISILLVRPAAVVNRQQMKQVNPNPNSEPFSDKCETCTGGKIKQTFDIQVPSNESPSVENIAETVMQITGEQTLVVSKEHETTEWKNAEEIWKYYSADVKKLQEAAKVVGVKNAVYDTNAMSLARKIFAAQNKQ